VKVTIDIDCTPEEARAFLGLPDLAPVHAAYIDRMTSLMTEGLSSADVEKMMRSWMPGMAEGFDQWRQAFWSAAGGKPQG
jgi:flagellar motor component MotA